jgi:hypothetical protein
MNITINTSQNKWIGGNRMEAIVIHWWNDPSKNTTLDGVVSWFLNPTSQVSAHYVVSGDTVVQMVEETDQAWHAMQANQFTIGIEVDPNTPGNTYKTLGELVRSIRSRRGNIPLKRHSDYVNTTCPGTIDLNRIERESKGDVMDERMTDNVWLGLYGVHIPEAKKKQWVGKSMDAMVTAERSTSDWKARNRSAKGLMDSNGQVDAVFLNTYGRHVSADELKKYKGKNWHETLDKLRETTEFKENKSSAPVNPDVIQLKPGTYLVK